MNKTLLAALLAWLAPTALMAGEPGEFGARQQRGAEMFKRWDSNGDGVVSRDEAQASDAERVAKKFDLLDKNKDGQLTTDELHQGHEDRMAAMKGRFDADFKKADQNGDGSLSKEEAAAMPKLSRHFADIDSNKDSAVSREEIDAHHAQRGRGRHGPPPSPPAPEG